MSVNDPRTPRDPRGGGFGLPWLWIIVIIIVVIGFGWGGWNSGWWGSHRANTAANPPTQTTGQATTSRPANPPPSTPAPATK